MSFVYLWEAFTTFPRYLRAFCTFFPSWALSWFTSGPTSRLPDFSYLSKSLRNRLKSRPSWEPDRRKSSWCFRLLGSFPSSHEISVKLNWELNFSSWRAFRGLFWLKYEKKLSLAHCYKSPIFVQNTILTKLQNFFNLNFPAKKWLIKSISIF